MGKIREDLLAYFDMQQGNLGSHVYTYYTCKKCGAVYHVIWWLEKHLVKKHGL